MGGYSLDNPFWSGGLDFECTQCSACCRFEPGLVLLSVNDIRRLMDHMGLDFRSFFTDYCRLVDLGSKKGISLRETSDFDCIFWKAGTGCSVYEARPVQCRTYPFWSGILTSKQTWEQEGRHCPGIGRNKHRARTEIEEALWAFRRNVCVSLPSDAVPESLDEDSILGS